MNTEALMTYIMQNDRPILEFPKPIRKVALWHVTSRCNMECKYCYGSFDGKSYKNNYSKSDLTVKTMFSAVDYLHDMGVERLHLCGGEPFLYNHFVDLLARIKTKKMESFVLTNLTMLPNYIEQLFTDELMTNLSFSLDSLDENYNMAMRGTHKNVIDNIHQVITFKKKHSSPIELGLYVVVTKKNLQLLIPLINWAIENGIEYISLQAVYLPREHKYYQELALSADDSIVLENVFLYLTQQGNKIRISGALMQFITRILLTDDNNLSIKQCFVEQNSQYFFILGDGKIKSCPAKSDTIGNIATDDFPMKKNNIDIKSICSTFCLDCIGVWEMVYPCETNDIIRRLK